MPQELIQFDSRRRLARVVFLLVIGVAAVWSYYGFRWFLGNTMAEYFNTEENNLNLAHIARNLAPNDPLTNWRVGQVALKKLPLDQLGTALPEYEKAVSLSPNDYRMWMSLGVAREQAGEVEQAEPALRQAVALAPAYAYPRWYLGNLLIRSGRYNEAFDELRKAGEADPVELQGQFFNLVSQVNGNDVTSLKASIGPNTQTRAQFAQYLVAQQKRDEGLAIWQSLSREEKNTYKSTGHAIISSLIHDLHFHDAVTVWNELAPVAAYRVEEGRISDGSFEEVIRYGPEVVFGWDVKPTLGMQIGIDPNVGHVGQRSLRLVFQVRTQLKEINVSQLIPIAADTTYDFEYFVKTAKLQSGAPPIISIVDDTTGLVLGTSDAAPTGDTDWNRVALTFKTSNKTEAVRLKISRPLCGEDATMCPIFGTVWYDDFSFKRHN